jgi:hypothetical protein
MSLQYWLLEIADRKPALKPKPHPDKPILGAAGSEEEISTASIMQFVI